MVFLDKSKLAEKHQKEFFYNAYYGDFGTFFDSQLIEEGSNLCHPMLERVMNIVRARKSNTREQFMPIVTNYYEAITSIKMDYVIGEGVNIIFQDDNDFYDWSLNVALRDKSKQLLSESMSVGYGGAIPSYDQGSIGIEIVDFRRIYKDGENSYLYSTQQDNNGVQFIYLVSILKGEEGYNIIRQAYRKADDKDNTLGEQVPLSYIFEEVEDYEIEDPITYKNDPLFISKSHVASKDDIADSIYRDVNSHIQALIVYDIFSFIETQQNFFSSMVVPESHFAVDPRTKEVEGLKNTQFMKSDGSVNPYFLTKEISQHHELMKDHRQDLQKNIALAAKIPAQVLMKDNGSERRVEIAKQDNLPFYLNTLQYQDQLVAFYRWAIAMYEEFNVTDLGEYYIQPDKSFIKDDIDTREFRLKQKQSGVLALKDYLSREYENLNAQQVDEMIANIEEEKQQLNQTLTTGLIDTI